MALVNSMTTKEDLCLQFGIILDKGEWDVACIPQRFFADRGELNGKKIEDAIASLGTSIRNAPAYRADTKGIIRESIGTGHRNKKKELQAKMKLYVDIETIVG